MSAKLMSVEQLSLAFENLRRDYQSSKDKAVKQTNARMDEMALSIESLRDELADLRDMLKDYLEEEVTYGK